ncbi:hypothetical protein AKO1_015847 [Acrasis kona]|uniref:MHD2 domain-containing protein n=1 Tax=Acrasis kona TaxID=1008807 RepID=A0AAW2ZJ44_9EUKA
MDTKLVLQISLCINNVHECYLRIDAIAEQVKSQLINHVNRKSEGSNLDTCLLMLEDTFNQLKRNLYKRAETMLSRVSKQMFDHVEYVLDASKITNANQREKTSKSGFRLLDRQLGILSQALNHDLLKRTLRNLFNSVVIKSKDLIVPSKPNSLLNQETALYLKEALVKFKEYLCANESLLSGDEIRLELNDLKSLLKMCVMPTMEMISEYDSLNRLVIQGEKQIEKETKLLEKNKKKVVKRVHKNNDHHDDESDDDDDDSESDHDDEDDDDELVKSDQEDDDEELDEDDDDDDEKNIKKQKSILTSEAQKLFNDRVIKRNYLFAFLNLKSQQGDSNARQVLDRESKIHETHKASLDKELELIKDSINHQQLMEVAIREGMQSIENEVIELKKNFKYLKSMKIITDRMHMRFKNKQLESEKIPQIHSDLNSNELLSNNILNLLHSEKNLIMNQFESRNVKAFDRHLQNLQIKVPTANDPNRILKFTNYFNCLSILQIKSKQKVDRRISMRQVYLCLVTSPKPCFVILTHSALQDLIKNQQTTNGIQEIQLAHIEILIKTKYQSVWDDSIRLQVNQNQTSRKYDLLGFKDRDGVFEVLEKFLVDHGGDKFQMDQHGKKAKKGIGAAIVNTMLLPITVPGKLLGISGKSKKVASPTESDQDEDDGDEEGYRVSDTLRNRFPKIKLTERLVNQYNCSEQKLPGTLYLFTQTICFDTTVNAGGNHAIMLSFDKITKIALSEKNLPQFRDAIQITERNGRRWVFSGLTNREEAFQEICKVVEKASTHLKYTFMFKESDNKSTIAVIVPIVEQNVTKNVGIVDIGKNIGSGIGNAGLKVGKGLYSGISVGVSGITSGVKKVGHVGTYLVRGNSGSNSDKK